MGTLLALILIGWFTVKAVANIKPREWQQVPQGSQNETVDLAPALRDPTPEELEAGGFTTTLEEVEPGKFCIRKQGKLFWCDH